MKLPIGEKISKKRQKSIKKRQKSVEKCKKGGLANMSVMCKPVNLAFRVDKSKTDLFLNQRVSKSQKKAMIESAKKLQKHLDDKTNG